MPRQHDAGCPSRPHGKCRRLLLPTRPRLGCPCLRPCVQVERQLKLRLDPQKAKMLERARAMGATVAPEFEQGARRQEGPLPPPPPSCLQTCTTLWACLPCLAWHSWCHL